MFYCFAMSAVVAVVVVVVVIFVPFFFFSSFFLSTFFVFRSHSLTHIHLCPFSYANNKKKTIRCCYIIQRNGIIKRTMSPIEMWILLHFVSISGNDTTFILSCFIFLVKRSHCVCVCVLIFWSPKYLRLYSYQATTECWYQYKHQQASQLKWNDDSNQLYSYFKWSSVGLLEFHTI